MDIVSLNQEIRDKKLSSSLYIFCGEEMEIMNDYIEKISSISNLPVMHIDSMDVIYHKIKNTSLFGTSYLYVIVEDGKYLKQQNSVWERFNQSNFGNDMVILIYSNLDKRSKFYNFHKEDIVLFEKLSEKVLISLAIKKFGISQDNASRLAKRCDYSYGRMVREYEKINNYAKATNLDIDKAFHKAFDLNLVVIDTKNVINDFIANVLDADYESTWFYKSIMEASNEPHLKILSSLYIAIKSVMQIQDCQSKNRESILNKTGISIDNLERYESFKGIYPTHVLINALLNIRISEESIKSGNLDMEIALEKCLCDLFLDDLEII